MICNNCNQQCADTDVFCSNCGATLEKETAAPASEPVVSQPVISNEVNPVVQKWQQIFSHSLFLVMAILVSCSAVFSLFEGTFVFSIDVISVLFTIFFWIIFASAKKNEVSAKHIRWISGTIYAQKIVNWVIVGVLGFLALISIFSASMLGEILDTFNYNFDREVYAIIANVGLSVFFVIFAVVLLLIAAAVVVINLLYISPAHQVAKSLYNGFIDVNKLRTIRTWSLVLGIISGVGALVSIGDGFASFISSACVAATFIVAYVWIDKITATNV